MKVSLMNLIIIILKIYYIKNEGMQVIEWNGIPLTGISHDEVSRIIANQIGDEIEVVIRTDINLLQNQYGHYNSNNMAPGPNPGYYGSQGYGYGPPPPPDSGYGPPPGPQPPSQPLCYSNTGYGQPPSINIHQNMKPPPSSTQPQVILQHNHPVDENYQMVYDQYGNRVPAPLSSSVLPISTGQPLPHHHSNMMAGGPMPGLLHQQQQQQHPLPPQMPPSQGTMMPPQLSMHHQAPPPCPY